MTDKRKEREIKLDKKNRKTASGSSDPKLFLFYLHAGEEEDRRESCRKGEDADRKCEPPGNAREYLEDRSEKKAQDNKVGRVGVRCHSTFQRSCDEDDPQHQSDPQWEEKGKVESADGVHGPVIQAQEEQQIRHADPWENESCRGDKSCDEEQEKARDSGGILRIEKIRGKKPQCGDRDQTKDDIPGDPPGEPSGAGLPDDQRHAACHSADTLRTLVEHYADKIETVMFPYNIVEDQGKDVLELAREKGMGTIAMKPLAGGNLEDWNLALRYIAASGVIDISIPGMGSPEEVDRTAAVDLTTPLTQEELEQCAAVRKELGTQFCRRCNYCAPCPNGIDIPSNFLMANYVRKYGLADWATARYKALPYHAGSCVQCGACEKRCPYNLPIRDMLADVAKVFGY